MKQILVPLIAMVLVSLVWLATRGDDSGDPLAVVPSGPGAPRDVPTAPQPSAVPAPADRAAAAATVRSPAAEAAAPATDAGDPVQCILFGRITDAAGSPIEGRSGAFLRFTDPTNIFSEEKTQT